MKTLNLESYFHYADEYAKAQTSCIEQSFYCKDTSMEHTYDWHIEALYKFVALTDLSKLQKDIKDKAVALDICGTLLLAPEGINGTISGSPANMSDFMSFLRSYPEFSDLESKASFADKKPFLRMKVRLKKEIVTLKQPHADPTQNVGTYVEPENWNEIITDPDTIVIDTRNDYEYAIGTFEGAVDPKTKSFTEFADYVKTHLDPAKNKKVAMFCTGGIRCEKASSYMLAEGYETVYHLKGGILKYLETIPKEESTWKGECFVFDGRVSVGHDLELGSHTLCYGCREPLAPEDLKDASYEEGVCCRHCATSVSEERKEGLRQRHSQMKHS